METATIPELVSNGFRLETGPTRLGPLSGSNPGDAADALRTRLREDGYLLLKGLLDPAAVIAMRRSIMEALAPAGLLRAGTDPALGVYSGAGRGDAHRLMADVARSEHFLQFCSASPLRRLFEQLLGGGVHLHRRKILRYTVPGDPSCTGAHYDLTYLRAGTDSVLTAWIPIGDTPVRMGGLAYLEGSDAAGRAMEAAFAATNATLPPEERISAYNRNMTADGWVTRDLPSLARRLNTRWLVADYEAGDVVVHTAYMIHAATMNTDSRIRLSTDIRYQRASEPIDQRWNQEWAPDDGL